VWGGGGGGGFLYLQSCLNKGVVVACWMNWPCCARLGRCRFVARKHETCALVMYNVMRTDLSMEFFSA
jgi:hypothetical protein